MMFLSRADSVPLSRTEFDWLNSPRATRSGHSVSSPMLPKPSGQCPVSMEEISKQKEYTIKGTGNTLMYLNREAYDQYTCYYLNISETNRFLCPNRDELDMQHAVQLKLKSYYKYFLKILAAAIDDILMIQEDIRSYRQKLKNNYNPREYAKGILKTILDQPVIMLGYEQVGQCHDQEGETAVSINTLLSKLRTVLRQGDTARTNIKKAIQVINHFETNLKYYFLGKIEACLTQILNRKM